jgi:hypothetical protein
MILKYITSLLFLVLISQDKQIFLEAGVLQTFLWARLPVVLVVGFSQALVVNAKLKFSSRQWPSSPVKVPTVNIRIKQGSDLALLWFITSTWTVFQELLARKGKRYISPYIGP